MHLRRFVRFSLLLFAATALTAAERPRVLVTTDGEIDDECSMVRFLLYANEWDIEGIINSSSQYHWEGSKLWAGIDWVNRYLDAYADVHANLVLHDPRFPTAEFLRSRLHAGNIKSEGEMDEVTPGSQRIVEVLLDPSDPRPVWIQAWGGTNTIARALKTIEEQHPDRMDEVARKARLYLIWEQDDTYQRYIRPQWEKHGLQSIIADQFWAFAYQWKKILPEAEQTTLRADWMKPNILEGHGALCSLYQAHTHESYGLRDDYDFEPGDFRSEGDSPAFLHVIPNGLRSLESPDFGGWGGRFVKVRENTWLDPVPEPGYVYPEGRWYTGSGWGRTYMRKQYPENQDMMAAYFNPQSRWVTVMQNDFAARADWCVRGFADANHPPVVKLDHNLDLNVAPGETVRISAVGSIDPDGDTLTYHWWQYADADTYPGEMAIASAGTSRVSFMIPADAQTGQTIHVVCEVTDGGSPALTRYQRVVFKIL